MAYEVRLAKRAINDLRHIYKTIEAGTSQAADVWFRGLESAIFTLETHPARGGGWPIHENSANTSGAPFMQSHRMSGHSGEARTVFLPDSHPPATLHP